MSPVSTEGVEMGQIQTVSILAAVQKERLHLRWKVNGEERESSASDFPAEPVVSSVLKISVLKKTVKLQVHRDDALLWRFGQKSSVRCRIQTWAAFKIAYSLGTSLLSSSPS